MDEKSEGQVMTVDGETRFIGADEAYRISDDIVMFRFDGKWFPVLSVSAHGCAMTRRRKDLWQKVYDDAGPREPPGHLRDHAKLREDPESAYDPDAIEVVCRGEDAGCLGYVAVEQTDAVRRFADMVGRDLSELHVMPAGHPERGQKTIQLIVWP